LTLTTLNVSFENIQTFSQVVGTNDRHLDVLNRFFETTIFTKGDTIQIKDSSEKKKASLEAVFSILIKLIEHSIQINERDVIYISKLVDDEVDQDVIVDNYIHRVEITKTITGKPIYAKTINQKRYLDAIEKNDLTFGIGPAGTGKTYVAVLHAVKLLKNGKIRKIILTRPAVEAGESLGFLPGI